jgi:hypothetical protein
MKAKLLRAAVLVVAATAAVIAIESPAHAVWTWVSDRRVKKDILPVKW